MPDISEVFSSSLKATDLGPVGSKVIVQIAEVEPVEFKGKDGSPQHKLRLSFVGKNKTMICNITNAKSIAKHHGSDYHKWIGKKITLEHALVDFAGDEVSGIRVPKPTNSASVAARQPVMVESENPAADMDDEIPF